MRPGAILQAAVEIIADIDASKRPADRILKEWGKKHRYAGSKDRAAISELVFGVYRHRRKLSWAVASNEPRLLVLGYHHLEKGISLDDLSAICSGTGYDAPPLTDGEHQALSAGPEGDPPRAAEAEAPDWILAEVMAPLDPVETLSAMQFRAPFDLRVNFLKASRDEAVTRLREELSCESIRGPHMSACGLSPSGIRFPEPVNLQDSPAAKEGLVEVQDEGSQLVCSLLEAKPGETVIDLCAGGGGKTLALAAEMSNEGRVVAADTDPGRLKEVTRRAARAGVTIAESLLLHDWEGEGADPDLGEWMGKADLVVLDVPCSGSGTWRRAPDAKWHLTPERLEELTRIQARILRRGAALVRPGGRLAYITCSVFGRENTGQIDRFLAQTGAFRLMPVAEAWSRRFGPVGGPSDEAASGLHPGCLQGDTLILAPHLSRTDGFYLGLMERKA